MLFFDDADNDFSKGWPVLETLRKYLTSPQLIILISGDLDLFSYLVRKKQWTNFGKALLKNEFDQDDGHPSVGGHDYTKMVEELQEWYTKQGLPPAEVTRFFIGEDYKDPKAFGIYKDASTGNFVVYKNKADGSRAVRYEGTDEAFAVNEIFMRLKQEILEQKAHNLKSDSKANSSGNGVSETSTSQTSTPGKASKPSKITIIILIAIFGQGIFVVAFTIFSLISGITLSEYFFPTALRIISLNCSRRPALVQS